MKKAWMFIQQEMVWLTDKPTIEQLNITYTIIFIPSTSVIVWPLLNK
jgi:hypothetical protein